jgi:hypothetical protein
MPAFASAFLGATTIRPGRYNALGTAVAVYTVAFIVAGLQQLGVPIRAENIVYGIALAGGVGLSRRLKKTFPAGLFMIVPIRSFRRLCTLSWHSVRMQKLSLSRQMLTIS